MEADNVEDVPLLSLHKNRLHIALENGQYAEACDMIKSEKEDFLMECFENYENYSPPSYKSSLHLIAAMKDQEQAVRLCRELLDRMQEAANKECLLNATVVEELTLAPGNKSVGRKQLC